jgi:segregation and condensation protein B
MNDTQQVTEDSPVPLEVSTEEPAEGAEAAEVAEAATPELDDAAIEALALRVEAALLTTDRAITAARLAEALSEPPKRVVAARHITRAVKLLNRVYDDTGRSFRIEQLAGGFQVLTLPDFADVLANLHRKRQDNRLSPAAMETLAIIAYKQPIIRADIESIRGVACGEVLRSLMERHLVKIVGRAEEIGRPMLYGTTRQFLETFGLSGLKDLPKVEELHGGRTTGRPAKSSGEATADSVPQTRPTEHDA